MFLDLAHNLGPGLNKFVMMREAIACGNWVEAARRLLASKYAGQVGARATRLAGILATGEMPQDMRGDEA